MKWLNPVPELSFLPAPYRGWTRLGSLVQLDKVVSRCFTEESYIINRAARFLFYKRLSFLFLLLSLTSTKLPLDQTLNQATCDVYPPKTAETSTLRNQNYDFQAKAKNVTYHKVESFRKPCSWASETILSFSKFILISTLSGKLMSILLRLRFLNLSGYFIKWNTIFPQNLC